MRFPCARCQHVASDDETAAEHALEAGHPRCIVCQRRSLGEFEVQTCGRCVGRVFADLADIEDAYARLEPVVSGSGYRMGGLPGGDALVMLASGALEGGGPDDWLTDPSPVVVQLHGWERDWRETFHDAHFPQWQATISSVVTYLREHLLRAARTHAAFDDFATELRTLRSRIQHVAGVADDPLIAPASCFDCGDDLARKYRRPLIDTDMQRPGSEVEGLPDDWTCLRCRRAYTPAEYWLAVRAALEEAS